jgi:hypothetical protein
MLKRLQGIIAGLIIGSIIYTALPSVALSLQKTIGVFTGVNIYVDDVILDPKDANGNPVETFIYNGTTYLPVRAISTALGKPIAWEGETSSVYIGKHSSDKPTAQLIDLDYFVNQGIYRSKLGVELGGGRMLDSKTYLDELLMDNLGNQHNNALGYHSNNGEYIIYKLNAQYSRLTGNFYWLYSQRTFSGSASVTIYGDNEFLCTSTTNNLANPVNIDIDITGILELRISMTGDWGYAQGMAAFGDIGLWN